MNPPAACLCRRGLLGLVGVAVPLAALALAPEEGIDVPVRRAITGIVTAVNADERLLTVRGPYGEVGFRADPRMRHLEQIKVGDHVMVDYVTTVALTLYAGDPQNEKAASEAAARRPAEERPAAPEAQPTTLLVDVLEVDRDGRMLKVKDAKGRVAEVRVDDPARLASLKPGDQVWAVAHQATAMSVAPVGR